MGGSSQPTTVSVIDNLLVIWPPIIQDCLAGQKQAQPSYERPQSHESRKRSWASAAWVGVGTSTAGMVGKLFLAGDRSAQLVGFLGLLGMGWGMWKLWHLMNEERSHTQQEQWRDYQSRLRQWQNAQRLLTRSRKRQLRQLLAEKVRQPTAKKSVFPNEYQRALIASLKHYCPQLSVHWGWEFASEEGIFRPDLTLLDEQTGLSLVLVIESHRQEALSEAWQKFFLEGNWVVVRLSEGQSQEQQSVGAQLARAIAFCE